MIERRSDDEAMDLGTLARDDALLDALGRGDQVPEGDEIATLLAAWRADLADDSATEVRPAAPPEEGAARPRPAVRRARPWTLRLAAAAVVLIALVSGLGVGSRNAGPDSPLWSLTRLLYPQQAEVRSIEDTIGRARTALSEGRLDDAERLIGQARRDLAAVDDPATVDRLRVTIDMLARELAAAREATAPATTGPTGAPTGPGPTTTGTPRPPASGAAPQPSTSPSAATSPLLPLPQLPLPTGPLLSPLPSLPLPLPTDDLLG